MSKRIGYTTGVFDIFHVGHLRLLQRAKSQCDYLIVGISTDELVEAYKNKRPVFSFDDRMEIVKNLKCVDEVVPQKHRDKVKAYHERGFDLMFVGDDWKGSELFMSVESELRKFGVKVVYFEYTKHVSSTSLTSALQVINETETAVR